MQQNFFVAVDEAKTEGIFLNHLVPFDFLFRLVVWSKRTICDALRNPPGKSPYYRERWCFGNEGGRCFFENFRLFKKILEKYSNLIGLIAMDLILKFLTAGFIVLSMPVAGFAQTTYSAMRQAQPTTQVAVPEQRGVARTQTAYPEQMPQPGQVMQPVPPRLGLFQRRAAFYGGEYPMGPQIGTPTYQPPAYQPGYAVSGYSSDPPWTQHLIKTEDRSYDFKTVAKGSRAEHKFVIKNAFQEKVHIASVTSSCSCTTVSIQDNKTELQTYEKAEIVALFRADLFDGHKSATITVVIDKPLHAEFHLNVRGDIRSDVTVKPGNVRFDNVTEGKEISRTIDVVYSGSNPAWKIIDFKSGSEHLSAEIEDVQSRPGLTTTKIRIGLDDKMPIGKFSERLYLVTNDHANRREIPILVEATVGTVVNITPETLFFGYLKPGEASSKIIVLQGSKPFRIKKIQCDNPAIESSFIPKEDAPPKTKHILPIRYLNPTEGPGAPKDGRMQAVVKIETDLPEVAPKLNVLMELAKEEAKSEDEKPKEKSAEN